MCLKAGFQLGVVTDAPQCTGNIWKHIKPFGLSNELIELPKWKSMMNSGACVSYLNLFALDVSPASFFSKDADWSCHTLTGWKQFSPEWVFRLEILVIQWLYKVSIMAASARLCCMCNHTLAINHLWTWHVVSLVFTCMDKHACFKLLSMNPAEQKGSCAIIHISRTNPFNLWFGPESV